MANNSTAQEMQVLVASPTTLAELVASLPAETRANLAWSPKRLADSSNELLTRPLLTDELIAKAADEYVEAVRMILPAIELVKRDFSAPIAVAKQRLDKDIELLASSIPHASMAAAMRAFGTVALVMQLSFKAAQSIDLALLRQQIAQFDSAAIKDDIGIVRTMALLIAVFEGLRHPNPVPGRVAELARRADLEAHAVASRLAHQNKELELPWYVEPATPVPDAVSRIAVWNPNNQPQWRNQAESPVSNEERQAWERVKSSIDAARPHRKLFS